MNYVLVFVAMFALDFVYAEYTKAAADRKAAAASHYATMLILLTGFVTSSYVSNLWYLIPAASGAWLGTYASMRWENGVVKIWNWLRS